MTNRVGLYCSAAIAAFLTVPVAQAADLPPPPAPIAPAPVVQGTDWGGLYLGLHVGGGAAYMDGVFENGSGSAAYVDNLRLNGVLGGVHGGFNVDMGRLVAGIEADISFADWNDRAETGSDDEWADGNVDLLASVRARLGVTMFDERTLLYVTGGVAFPSATVESDRDGDSESHDFTDIGGVVGGGFEFASTQNLRLRAEGLYYFFDERVSAEGGSWPEATTGDYAKLEDAWVVRLGASWYFNQ